MKRTARLLALLLALVMALSLAACGTSESASSSDSSTDETSSSENDTEADTSDTEDSGVWEGEVTEINIYVMDMNSVSEYSQKVVDAMNAITETSIGVTANITYVSTGDYASKLSLAISGGEQVDICMIAPIESSSFTSLIANGQLMDITDILADEGAELLELVGDYVEAYEVSGRIYGVPAFRNYSSGTYLYMRTDILEELGLLEFAQNVTTWSEVEEIFAAVAENTDLIPIGGAENVIFQAGNLYGSDAFADTTLFDSLSDDLMIVYTDENGSISLLPENEDFRAQMEMVREWYDNGWIYEDSLVTTEMAYTMIGAGVTFAGVSTSELGIEATAESATGYEMTVIQLTTNMLGSTYINKFGFAVPVTAEEPEAAVRWMNALYTSEELMNLLVWGIEDEDYVVVDGEAAYPDGVTEDTVEYHTADFLYGNYFLVYPWSGSGADFREEAYEALQAAELSPYLGFTVDQSDLSNQIAAVTSVVDKYKATILCGVFSDDEYEAYVQALKDAGVEELLSAYQEQLDEWLAEN